MEGFRNLFQVLEVFIQVMSLIFYSVAVQEPKMEIRRASSLSKVKIWILAWEIHLGQVIKWLTVPTSPNRPGRIIKVQQQYF